MDYEIISDTPAPPNDVITTVSSDGIWWTVRVRDQYGSTIYADPKYFSTNPDPKNSVEVNEANDGEQVELDPGQILVVTLESNPSTGYRWEVAENNEFILEQLGEAEFKPSDTGDPPLVGAGGWEIFRFKPVGAGQMILKLVYRRPWEDTDPFKTFSIEVIIH
jgi:inhibitor of cysteine peptidase